MAPDRSIADSLRTLRRRLLEAERGYQGDLARRLLLGAVPWALGAILIAALLDMALHLTPGVRLAADLAGLALAGGLLAWAAHIRWRRRRSDEAIARHLEDRDPGLGSALINSLQLAADPQLETARPATRQLAARALAEYRARWTELRFAERLRLAPSRRCRWAAGVAATVWLGLLAGFAGIARLELARFADPFGDHPPFSLTALEIVEPAPSIKVVYGQSLLVKVKHQGHAPGEVFLSFHDPAAPGTVTTLPMFNKGDLGFYQQVENVKTPMVLTAHTANRHAVSRQRLVEVILTPRVDKAFVEVAAPAYTCLAPVERPWTFQNVKALAGSKVRFRIVSNRPLGGGVIGLAGTVSHDGEAAMTPTGEREVAGELTATESGRLRFTIADVDGNPSHDLLGGSLTVVQDLEPQIVVTNPERDSFITEDFRLEAEISASDDYGIAELRLHRALNGRYSAPKIYPVDGCRRSVREKILFDLPALGVSPGDRISFFAEALDTCPAPHLAASRIVTLVVVGVEEYNEFLRERMAVEDIRQKYDQLAASLRELADEQRRLNREIDELRRQLAAGEAPDPEALQDRLNDLIARQSELNGKLGKLAGQMEDLGRDEPVYDLEKEFRKMLAERAAGLRQSADLNRQALDRFDNRSGTASGLDSLSTALKEFADDGQRQLEAIQGSADAIDNDIVATIDELAKMNALIRDFNQLKMLYDEQCAVAQQARAYDVARDLSTADKLALRRFASREKAIADLLETVTGNLRRHADDAAELFPRASQSARDLAGRIEQARLKPLAEQTANTMLIPDGPGSYQLAERLRQEMETLFAPAGLDDCEGQCAGDLDAYLRLYLLLDPGNLFQQMSQSRKAGGGYAYGFGIGIGAGGESGYAVPGPNVGLLGNERLPSEAGDGEGTPSRGDGPGPGQPTGAIGARTDIDRQERIDDPEAALDSTRSLPVEATIHAYKELVDRYFQKIIEADRQE